MNHVKAQETSPTHSPVATQISVKQVTLMLLIIFTVYKVPFL